MTDIQENHHSFIDASLPSFKDLRKRSGISIEEIQKQTLFSRSKLTALDEMRFDDLGSNTFAIAYMQKYAKIVGFDVGPYIEQYRTKHIAQDEENPTVEAGSQAYAEDYSSARITKKPAKTISWITQLSFVHYAVIVAVIWIFVIVFQPQKSASVASVTEKYDEVEKNEIDRSDSTQLQNTSEVSSKRPKESYTEEFQSDNKNIPKSKNTDLTLSIGELGNEDQTAVSSDSSIYESDQLAMASDEGLFVEAENQNKQDTLFFSFTDECWVKVSDATGKVIFANTSNKGDNLQLLGQGPFEILLGNAKAATLFLNGELYPITPHVNRRTLKFVVTP